MDFKKICYTILGIAMFIPSVSHAYQITVPSAPGANYCLISTTTGAYVASTTVCANNGGSPGGSSGDIQYNLGGLFAGDGGLTWNRGASLFEVNGISMFDSDITVSGIGQFNRNVTVVGTTTSGALVLPNLSNTVLAVDGSGVVIATTTTGGGTNYFSNSGATTTLTTGSILTALTGTFGTINATSTTGTSTIAGTLNVGSTTNGAYIFQGDVNVGSTTLGAYPSILMGTTTWLSPFYRLDIEDPPGFSGNVGIGSHDAEVVLYNPNHDMYVYPGSMDFQATGGTQDGHINFTTAGSGNMNFNSNNGNIVMGNSLTNELQVSGNTGVISFGDPQGLDVGDYMAVDEANSKAYTSGLDFGIGTSTPTTPLEVVGSGFFSGNVTAAKVIATSTVSIATSSTSAVLNLGDDPATASSTIIFSGKIQIQGKDTTGALYCMEVTTGLWVSKAGACTP